VAGVASGAWPGCVATGSSEPSAGSASVLFAVSLVRAPVWALGISLVLVAFGVPLCCSAAVFREFPGAEALIGAPTGCAGVVSAEVCTVGADPGSAMLCAAAGDCAALPAA